MEIIFIRHAQTYEKVKRLVDSKQDPELSSLGIKSSKDLRQVLHAIPFDRVYVSPMKRAKQTARIVFPDDITVQEESGLNEVDLGWISGMRYGPISFALMFVNYYWSAPFGSEPRSDYYTKVKQTFKQIQQECIKNNLERVVIVTHNGVILTILWHYLHLINFQFSVDYAHPYVLKVSGTDLDNLTYSLGDVQNIIAQPLLARHQEPNKKQNV